jgi:UDP-N-acetylmuramoyl-L-alanyl-D-glutamate--2,6-diaminopimelate ligase
LGTLGCGPFGAQKANDNTTADAVTVQRELAKAVSYGCGNAAMEVSSHGLVQGRVSAVEFDVAVFTNLTRDHLDYHQTMEAYGDAKRQLFLTPGLSWAIINVDDKFGRKLKKDPAITAKKLFVTLNQPGEGADLDQWLWADDVRLTLKGIKARVYTPWGTGKLDVPLIGRFNLYNLLSVIAVLGTRVQDINTLFDTVNQLQSVNGRMQLIQHPDQPLIIVDYAHTPDALEQALKAAREHCSGKIITVFGCGGDRDPGKRPLMARVAERYSNRVIFTDDNPRTEAAQSIIQDMRKGLKTPDKVAYIADRKAAMQEAVAMASPADLILVAGKGHEDYQIVGTEKIYFSDVKAAKEVLEEQSL